MLSGSQGQNLKGADVVLAEIVDRWWETGGWRRASRQGALLDISWQLAPPTVHVKELRENLGRGAGLVQLGFGASPGVMGVRVSRGGKGTAKNVRGPPLWSKGEPGTFKDPGGRLHEPKKLESKKGTTQAVL